MEMRRIQYGLGCALMAATLLVTAASAQPQLQTPVTPQPGPITRVTPVTPSGAPVLAPITPQLRADFARRALGATVAPTITGTGWVTPQAPTYNAGELSLTGATSAGIFDWQPDSITIAARVARIDVAFRAAPRARYLVVCDLNQDGAWQAQLSVAGGAQVAIPVVWDSGRALMVVPSADGARAMRLSFSTLRNNGDPLAVFRRCEVSQLS
jgi:hypothetical protein